jgi:DNA-binding MarR family transcriptional regulator/GNAT superfamily N-acetyltransferase
LDIITELGELAFASRLKRLSERLMKDVSLLYKKLNVDFEARWFSIFYFLNRQSPKTITELAHSLHLTHTAVNQLAAEMIKKGLIVSSKGKKDERQRFLAISPEGKKVASTLLPVWEEIRSETKALIESTNKDLLSNITQIEKKLDDKNMYERIWFRLKGSIPGKIKIVEYRPALKKHFNLLNREWLEEYFVVEKGDEKFLSDPNRTIIKTGGLILFACIEDQVVGTGSLIKHRDDLFEIGKVAVTNKFQGNGIGEKLIRAILDKAKKSGIKMLYLQTSPALKAANNLYYKFGFRKTTKNLFGTIKYHRPTFVMKLNLKNTI